jgi:hypothetical protein
MSTASCRISALDSDRGGGGQAGRQRWQPPAATASVRPPVGRPSANGGQLCSESRRAPFRASDRVHVKVGTPGTWGTPVFMRVCMSPRVRPEWGHRGRLSTATDTNDLDVPHLSPAPGDAQTRMDTGVPAVPVVPGHFQQGASERPTENARGRVLRVAVPHPRRHHVHPGRRPDAR